jgi:hypothetical protein
VGIFGCVVGIFGWVVGNFGVVVVGTFGAVVGILGAVVGTCGVVVCGNSVLTIVVDFDGWIAVAIGPLADGLTVMEAGTGVPAMGVLSAPPMARRTRGVALSSDV